MKKTIAKLLLTIPICVLLASVTSAAYTAPTVGSSGDNGEIASINLGTTDQIKNGGLSVYTFLASSGAQFDQDVSFTGMIRGGLPSDISSTVAFGNTSTSVGVKIAGLTSIDGKFQSDVLKTGGGEKPLCAMTDGTIYLCGVTTPPVTPPITPPVTQTDQCPNLAGTQTSIPNGMTKDNNGDCVTVPTVTGYTFDPAGEDINVLVCGKGQVDRSCQQVASTAKRLYRLTINLDQPLIVDTTFTVNFEWKWYGYKDSASGVKSFTIAGTQGSNIVTGTFLWDESTGIATTGIQIIPERVRAYCIKVQSPAAQYISNNNTLNTIQFTTLPITGGLANGLQPYPGGPYSPVGINCQ